MMLGTNKIALQIALGMMDKIWNVFIIIFVVAYNILQGLFNVAGQTILE